MNRYQQEMNREFAKAYGPKDNKEILWAQTVPIEPHDVSVLDALSKARAGGYWFDPSGMICIEFHYVNLKPFDPFEFVNRHNETEEEFKARMLKKPEFEPVQKVLCMCKLPDLMRDCKQIEFSAYTDGTLLIEQWTAADVEFRRDLARLSHTT